MACCGGKKYVVKMPQVPEPKITVPQLQADGSIKFPGPAPVVEGYAQCPEDETVVRPKGEHCLYRITGIMLQRDGIYRPYHACRQSQCPHRGKEVNFTICQTCPFREG